MGFLYQLWAGHLGGFEFDGKMHYLTDGKRSPQVPPGVYEGIFNREICENVHQMTSCQTVVVNPGLVYVTHNGRVALSNDINDRTGKRSILLFIHGNAMGNGREWNDAHGFRVFHGYNASSRSKWLAERLHAHMDDKTKLAPRSLVRDSKWIVLTRTSSPAVFLEAGFMTNLKDAAYMASTTGKEEIAMAISESLEDFDAKFGGDE